jgi:hypothetical protein
MDIEMQLKVTTGEESKIGSNGRSYEGGKRPAVAREGPVKKKAKQETKRKRKSEKQ